MKIEDLILHTIGSYNRNQTGLRILNRAAVAMGFPGDERGVCEDMEAALEILVADGKVVEVERGRFYALPAPVFFRRVPA
jgi:hypothetical protein